MSKPSKKFIKLCLPSNPNLSKLLGLFHSIKGYKILLYFFMVRPIIYFSCFLSLGFSNIENIGLCISSKGLVERTGLVRNGFLRRGDAIYNGDKIILREGKDFSFMIINEKIIIKAFNKSIFKIYNKGKGINVPELALFDGKVFINMDKNYESKIFLNTPEAIATTKGANFIVEYKDNLFFNSVTYSIFTVLFGKIKLENKKSGKIIFVNQGETIISTRDGKFFEMKTIDNSSTMNNNLYGE